MHSRLVRLLCALIALALLPASTTAQTTPAPKPTTFIYVLRLVERLHDDQAWTKADQDAVGAHFERLKLETANGKVIFAGRTMESGARTFGIVVFQATDLAEATAFADADPAVTGGVMSADTRPFALVLQRK